MERFYQVTREAGDALLLHVKFEQKTKKARKGGSFDRRTMAMHASQLTRKASGHAGVILLVSLGMLQEAKRLKPVKEDDEQPAKTHEEQFYDDLATIFRLSGGIASVIIPVVRNLAAAAAKISG